MPALIPRVRVSRHVKCWELILPSCRRNSSRFVTFATFAVAGAAPKGLRSHVESGKVRTLCPLLALYVMETRIRYILHIQRREYVEDTLRKAD